MEGKSIQVCEIFGSSTDGEDDNMDEDGDEGFCTAFRIIYCNIMHCFITLFRLV